MKDLKITLIQSSLAWENPSANLEHFEQLIKKIRKNSTHLIVLPEMFTTGFTMNAAAVAETMDGPAVTWMVTTAQNKKAVVCGSVVIREKGKFYNRLIWAQPDGKLFTYDKRHLFRMAHEQNTYAAGKKKIFMSINGWNILPLICYDLRFPVWSRNKNEVDLMVYVANWPERRIYAWKQLLIARAIENQCYVAGLNRIGEDGNKIPHSGDSVVLDPLGMPMGEFATGKAIIKTTVLRANVLIELRKKFPVAMDADNFKIL